MTYIAIALKCIIVPIVVALFIRGTISRSEKCVLAFYYPLREKYPRSYIKQNRVIKFIRNICKMDTKSTVHWVRCVFHYLQLVTIAVSLLSLFLLIIPQTFISIENIDLINFIVVGVLFGIVNFTDLALMIFECSRCKKIKKENPKYSKKEILDYKVI